MMFLFSCPNEVQSYAKNVKKYGVWCIYLRLKVVSLFYFVYICKENVPADAFYI